MKHHNKKNMKCNYEQISYPKKKKIAREDMNVGHHPFATYPPNVRQEPRHAPYGKKKEEE